MNEPALLEEVKPLLDRMAKATGSSYCVLQLEFTRWADGSNGIETGAYVADGNWQYGTSVEAVAEAYIATSGNLWNDQADKAAARAEEARLNYEKLFHAAVELRSKALAMQAAEPPTTLPAIASDNLPAQLAEVGEK